MIKEKKRDHLFKPGQSGNPEGRGYLPRDVKVFKETTYKDFINKLQKYGAMTPDEMEREIKRPSITMFEKIFGTVVMQAANGDKTAREVLFDRVWGKVKEQKETELDVRTLNPERMLEAGKAALKVLEAEVVDICVKNWGSNE